jgi:Zn-dependent protease
LGVLSVGTQTVNVVGSVYRAAVGTLTGGTVRLAAIREGDVFATGSVAVGNGAVVLAGYNETLDVSLGGAAGAATIVNGSSDTAVVVTVARAAAGARVGRRLGGGSASITLWGLGGLAYNHGGRFTRSGNFWRVAAGPGDGFALGLLVVLMLCIGFGPLDGLNISSALLFKHLIAEPSDRFITFLSEGGQRIKIIHDFLWINFWWGVINLLPVLPLDGGRIVDLFVKPQKRVYQIGFIAATSMAIFAATRMGLWTVLMFGYLAYRNFQQMRENSWS